MIPLLIGPLSSQALAVSYFLGTRGEQAKLVLPPIGSFNPSLHPISPRSNNSFLHSASHQPSVNVMWGCKDPPNTTFDVINST